MPRVSDEDARRCITTPSGVNASKVALAASLIEARRERDEARAEVERLRVALGKIASIDPHVNGVGLYCREFATAVLAEGAAKGR